ncbi:hypothetical protein EON63_07865 [archaeon]|nr:MAG: hypothetical protein EON63_07865 [archaeon]
MKVMLLKHVFVPISTGIMNLMDPMKPDRLYRLDLRRYEQREFAKVGYVILISISVGIGMSMCMGVANG